MSIGFAFYSAVCNREKTFNILKKLAAKNGLSCGIYSNSAWVSFCRNGVINFNYEDGCLSCDCQTNVAGPGFHKAAIEFTEEFLRKTKLSTYIDDEAEYLEHRDFFRMRSEHFDNWLCNIVRLIKQKMSDSNEYQNMMVSWDVDQYTPRSIDGSVVMGTGRFAATKLLDRIEREGIEPFARDFFIWYEPEHDAYFYRNSALSRMWEDCYFRPSARSDKDKSVNEYIRTHLEKAAGLSSDIPLPLKEYRLLCEYDGIPARQLRNPELETDYPIGYRREMVTETIGNLKITLPGSFLCDTENNLVYYDNEDNWHSVVITALLGKNTPEFAPQVFADVQSPVEDFPAGDGCGRMAYAGQQKDGSYHVIAQILSGMQVTFITVSFGNEVEKEWAFEFLRGLKATVKEDIEVAKFNEELYLVDMYQDPYFPDFLVDKIKELIVEVVDYLESGEHSIDDIQAKFDEMTNGINNLQEEFEQHDSEIETGARESIGQTVDEIIKHFNLDIDCETAIGNRDW